MFFCAHLRPLGFFERPVLQRHLHLCAVQQFFYGEYLYARVVLAYAGEW